MRGARHPEQPSSTPPPYLEILPDGPSLPIVISVPHAGRFYPPQIEAARGVGWKTLHDLEDRYADRLIGPSVAAGATAIVATHARAWLDLNRDADDLPDRPTSPQGRAGLGLVPLRLGGRPLWRHAPATEEVDARIATIHAPYHAAIARALQEAHRRHGHALLIDCHSMPPIANGPRLVIGDRHGQSAEQGVVVAIQSAAEAARIVVSRNVPYAGAYTIGAHGAPGCDIHAVQIEFDRALYLRQDLREPAEGLAMAATLLARLCQAGAAAMALPMALAAE